MENTYQPTEHLLEEIEFVELYQAGAGKRLANYLIDDVFVYVIWRWIFFKQLVSIETFVYRHSDESKIALYFVAYLLVIGWSILYKAGLETIGNGKTLGKLITGTRAVNDDGSRISGKTALLRSLSRMVPFEVFSALGNPCYPWHDRWTKSLVVDDNLSHLPAAQ